MDVTVTLRSQKTEKKTKNLKSKTGKTYIREGRVCELSDNNKGQNIQLTVVDGSSGVFFSSAAIKMKLKP